MKNGFSNNNTMYPNRNTETLSEESSLYDQVIKYWWLVRRRLWLVIICAIIGSYYQYDKVSSVKELYSSRATVILDGGATDRAVALLGIPGARYGYQNEMYILRSEQLSRKVAESLLNRFEKTSKGDTLQILKSNRGLESLERVAARVRGIVRFYSKEENQSVIEILATAADPYEAAIIANTYAYTYEAYNKESSIKQVIDAKRFLRNQIEVTSDSLRKIEANLVGFLKKNGFSYMNQNLNSLMNQLSSLFSSLDEAKLTVITNGKEIEAINATLAESRKKETESLLEAPDRFIAYYEEKIQEILIQIEEEKTKQNLNPNADKSILNVSSQKAEVYKEKLKYYLDKKLDNNILLSNVDGSIAKYWVELNARKIELTNQNIILPRKIEEIESKIEEYTDQLEVVPFTELEYEKIQRRKARYELALSSFYNKLIETELAEASEGGFVDILDNAKPNYSPINKQTTTGVFQGLFFGIILAVAVIIILDRLDNRIKSNEDLIAFNLKLAAGIPSMQEIINKEFNGKTFVEFGGAHVSTRLLTMLKPLSGTAEMYRRLRATFLFSLPDKKRKSIVVTSANPQEGKSITASNLAIVLAQSGKSVLLIDADLRRPNLDVVFGCANSPGLSDAIIHGLEPHEVSYPTVAENLYLIPSGSQVPNPAEIIGSDAFRVFFEKITAEFDFVIYDSPPTNSVVDAVSIAELVDLVLVVVKAGKTKRKELGLSIEILKYIEQKIVGILMNDISNRSYITDYNYYSNYNYYGNRVSEYEGLTPGKKSKSTIDV